MFKSESTSHATCKYKCKLYNATIRTRILQHRNHAAYLHNFSVWHHFAAWIAASDVEVTLVELPKATAVHGRVVAAVHTGYVETLR
jgi:hypothetical protein